METIGFNIEDVLDLAIQMENNGVSFYEAASKSSKETDLQKMFNALATMEKEHLKKFVRLKERIVKPDTTIDPVVDSAVTDYLLSWVDGEVFDKDSNAASIVNSGNTSDILRTAIQLENGSIAFYTGLREFVANEETEDIVGEIIKEEFRHVAQLNTLLKSQL